MSRVKTIYGLFPGPHSADRAMAALEAAGIDRTKLVVMAPEPFEEHRFAQADPASAMPWIAVLGGVIGGVGGYALAWYTQVARPLVTGAMPIVAPWPTGIITYELTMMGAIVATVIALLVSAKLPNWKPALYDPEISHGKILIGVEDPSPDARADIESRLRQAGAEKIKAVE